MAKRKKPQDLVPDCPAARHGTKRAAGVTDLRMFPVRDFLRYLVFYRPVRDGIEVHRVLHPSGDVETIFEGNA